MKGLTTISPVSSSLPGFAVLPNLFPRRAPFSPRPLVAEWQPGPETLSGHGQWKLRLTFASPPLAGGLTALQS
jgi:hypothetical protein